MAKGDVSDNKFGFASFILGLFSLIFVWALFIPSIVMGITGIIFAIIQLRKGKNGLTIAGLILSIIAVIAAIVLLFNVMAFVSFIAACQTDPNSSACTTLAEKMGVDAETLKCMNDPNAPGCEQFPTNSTGVAK